MSLSPELRRLAGEAALKIIRDGEARGIGTPVAEPARPTSDAERADGLVQQAAKGLVLLAEHNRALESFAQDRAAWTDSEVQRLEDQASLWERAVDDIERQIREVELRSGQMGRRAEAAEREVLELQDRLTLLRGKIALAFGPGSDAATTMADPRFTPKPRA